MIEDPTKNHLIRYLPGKHNWTACGFRLAEGEATGLVLVLNPKAEEPFEMAVQGLDSFDPHDPNSCQTCANRLASKSNY